MRYVGPYLLSLFIKKAQNRMMNDEPDVKRRKEGEVKVDYIPKKNKANKKNNLGDFTDFEDVEE